MGKFLFYINPLTFLSLVSLIVLFNMATDGEMLSGLFALVILIIVSVPILTNYLLNRTVKSLFYRLLANTLIALVICISVYKLTT